MEAINFAFILLIFSPVICYSTCPDLKLSLENGSASPGICKYTERLMCCVGTDDVREHLRNFSRTVLSSVVEFKYYYGSMETLSSEDFGGMKPTKIKICNSNLSAVDDETFAEFQVGIDVLMLQDNLLTEVPIGALQNLPKVSTLGLSGNSISSLGSTLLRIPGLRYLSLAKNSLTSLDEKSLPSGLKTIMLGSNGIRTLNGAVRDLRELTWLLIPDNELTSVQGELTNLVDLQYLQLSDNKIGAGLGNSFENLFNLKHLLLSRNRIQHLSDSPFASLAWLDTLEIKGNLIGSLEGDPFSTLISLRRLDLSFNQLDTLPADVFRPLIKLEKLNLSGNKLTQIPSESFSSLSILTYLNLAHNRLTNLDTGSLGIFRHNPKLRILDLRSNSLETLDKHTFIHNRFLKILKIRDNPLLCDKDTINLLENMDANYTMIFDKPECTNNVEAVWV